MDLDGEEAGKEGEREGVHGPYPKNPLGPNVIVMAPVG